MPARPVPTYTPMLIGHAVRTQEARVLAELASWLRTRGGQLLPSTRVDRTITAGTTITLRARAWCSPRAIDRVWALTVRAGSATSSTRIDVTTGGATTTYAVTPLPVPIIHTEQLAASVSGDHEIACAVTAVGGSAIIDEVACWEIDRPSSDVPVESCAPGQPIADLGSYASISGAWAAASTAESRRAGLVSWIRGSVGVSFTSASTLFPVPVPVLARLITRGTTTTQVRWSAYGRSVTAAWTLRLTTTASGVVDDLVVPVSGSESWTTTRTVSIHAEDPASSDGRRAGVWDELQIQVLSPGSGSLILSSVSVHE